jgi:hypothetical protein
MSGECLSWPVRDIRADSVHAMSGRPANVKAGETGWRRGAGSVALDARTLRRHRLNKRKHGAGPRTCQTPPPVRRMLALVRHLPLPIDPHGGPVPRQGSGSRYPGRSTMLWAVSRATLVGTYRRGGAWEGRNGRADPELRRSFPPTPLRECTTGRGDDSRADPVLPGARRRRLAPRPVGMHVPRRPPRPDRRWLCPWGARP